MNSSYQKRCEAQHLGSRFPRADSKLGEQGHLLAKELLLCKRRFDFMRIHSILLLTFMSSSREKVLKIDSLFSKFHLISNSNFGCI